MAYRQLQITDKVRITDGSRNHGQDGEVKAVTSSSARVRFYCYVNKSYREQWFRQSSLIVAANTPVIPQYVKPQYQTTPQYKEKRMTPAQKLGYKVGDKFTVTTGSTFELGATVTLYRDDGSDCPLFSGEKADTVYTCCDGKPGAYLMLYNVTPRVEPAKPQAPQFKVGDKVKIISDAGFERVYVGCTGTISEIDEGRLPVRVDFEDGDYDWGDFEGLELIGAVPANVKEKLAEIARLTADVARLTAEVQELLG